MASIYTVQAGQELSDCVINATGVLTPNWNLVANANGYLDWNPPLTPGQQIIIPDGVIVDLNAVNQFAAFPLSNFSVADIGTQINELMTLIV